MEEIKVIEKRTCRSLEVGILGLRECTHLTRGEDVVAGGIVRAQRERERGSGEVTRSRKITRTLRPMLMPAHHHSPSITRRIRQQQLHRSVYIYIPTAFLVPPLYSSAGRRGVVLSVDLHTRNRFPLIAPHLSLSPIRMYKRRTLKLTTIIFFLVPQKPPQKNDFVPFISNGGEELFPNQLKLLKKSKGEWEGWVGHKDYADTRREKESESIQWCSDNITSIGLLLLFGPANFTKERIRLRIETVQVSKRRLIPHDR